MKQPSELELAFETWWRQVAMALGEPIPEYRTQYEFFPGRKYALDVAFPDIQLAIELDGGTQGKRVICHHCHTTVHAIKNDGTIGAELRIGSGHSTGAGSRRDREKGNLAALGGWTVFRFTREMIEDDPIEALGPIVRMVIGRRLRQAAMWAANAAAVEAGGVGTDLPAVIEFEGKRRITIGARNEWDDSCIHGRELCDDCELCRVTT